MNHTFLKSLALSSIFAVSGGCAFLTSAVPEKSMYCQKVEDSTFEVVNANDQKRILAIHASPTNDKAILREEEISTFDHETVTGKSEVNLAEKTCTVSKKPEHGLFTLKKEYRLK